MASEAANTEAPVDGGDSVRNTELDAKPSDHNSGSGSGSDSEPAPQAAPKAKPESESASALASLTPEEFRIYNRLADQMDYFHDHFRQMYTTLHMACTTGRRPVNLTLKQFIDEGLRLARYLEGHHSIEETHLYPLLARKMPEFRASSTSHKSSSSSSSSGGGGGGGGSTARGKGNSGKGKKEECELIRQHRIIHDGMEEMVEYLQRCRNRECELELGVLKEKIEPWGAVLLRHLDQEVRDLGADKMRRHWTLQEMKTFPI
ncbi:hypothetical protein N657DRAFT_645645 [Parathielavia appendiculata]|uniref:Hemerythrin-like domain-containing protein n=1 Tax=Parathielavia appendiculata TaxID=2587402 RepID=A0AAN6U1D0_9PEZI|nr:hypothetical protein N657DRAFT_645645 [Parathielavia appendiculata]